MTSQEFLKMNPAVKSIFTDMFENLTTAPDEILRLWLVYIGFKGQKAVKENNPVENMLTAMAFYGFSKALEEIEKIKELES